jgi:acetyl-CoA synthetase
MYIFFLYFLIGGLLDVLLSSLHYGIPVFAYRFKKFNPELAFELISKYNIKNMFMPPTALKMMRTISNPQEK